MNIYCYGLCLNKRGIMLYTPKEASKILGISTKTLERYANQGKIICRRTEGGHRRYDVEQYLTGVVKREYKIVYCRVSSSKQKDDLERQVLAMRELYPDATIIEDIGSGINYNRKGIKTILELLLRGDRISLVVAHRDRLARFGTELFEFLLKSNGGELVVLDDEAKSSEQKLTEDLLTILHVFSCRMHGSLKYKKDKDKT